MFLLGGLIAQRYLRHRVVRTADPAGVFELGDMAGGVEPSPPTATFRGRGDFDWSNLGEAARIKPRVCQCRPSRCWIGKKGWRC